MIKDAGLDGRVVSNLNVLLKYRTVLGMERKKAEKVGREMLEQSIDLEMVRLHEQQFPAEDFERIVRERPSNLYVASRIRGIR